MLTDSRSGVLTFGALFALYFASSGVESLRVGLNRAYDMSEERAWWLLRMESIAYVLVAAMAARNSGSPGVGEYLWLWGSRQASTAASTMAAGVEKSGSPAPKPITSSPAALRALALASMARVAEAATAETRAEIRAIAAMLTQ